MIKRPRPLIIGIVIVILAVIVSAGPARQITLDNGLVVILNGFR